MKNRKPVLAIRGMLLLLVTVVVIMASGIANATPTATRTLPAEPVPADGSFSVEIEVSDYGTVVETLPDGFTFIGSSLDSRAVILYGPTTIAFKLTKEKYFTYYVALKYYDLEEGTYTFSGILRDRKGEEYEIGGDTEIAVKLAPRQFDTGSPANPYPSIFGTHNGTITPSQTITVQKLYTYPCPGTGGHTESIELYENGTLIANGTWNGYKGDWHNISLNNVTSIPYVTLLKDHVYNYTIRTGSYPCIIHETSFNATGGTITCTDFTSANGKRYEDWILAIRLE